MSEREVKFFLVLDLKVCYVGKDGGKYTFCVYNHTSKQFTWMSMQVFRIPIGVIPDNLTSNYAIFLLLQALVNAFIELGNGDGGWDLSGWSKRGVVVDMGAEQSTASYKPTAK
jgi:hypothetical protein